MYHYASFDKLIHIYARRAQSNREKEKGMASEYLVTGVPSQAEIDGLFEAGSGVRRKQFRRYSRKIPLDNPTITPINIQ